MPGVMAAGITTAEVIGVLFVAAFTRSTLGFGEALISVPILSLLIPVRIAAPIAVLTSITVAATVLAQDWRHVHLRSASWLILPTLIGTPLGLLLLTRVPTDLVRACLGLVIAAFCVFSLVRPDVVFLRDDRLAWAFGFIAGVFGGAFGMNGPPLAIYGTLRGWTTQRFRATLQGYFLPASTIALVGYAAVGLLRAHVIYYYLVSLPGVLVATLLGRLAAGRMDTRLFTRCVNAGLLIIAGMLLLQSLTAASMQR
jgi:uncharacterized membrane protein YfcA